MLEGIDTSVAELDEFGDEPIFQNALATLPFRVSVPREMVDQYEGPAPTKTTLSEQRRFVRFRHLARGVIRYEQTYPAIVRDQALHAILITNVSRCGIGLLNEEQLFPNERMTVWMSGRGLLRIHVARCRKINDLCYEIGASFGLT